MSRFAPVVVALVALPLVVNAANWRFLQHSPASQFTEKDFELFTSSGEEALDEAPDGDNRGWKNPDTGAFGTVQPLSTYEAHGTTCRKVEIFNSAGGFSATSRFDFCQQADGSWKVAP
jgi:surface antigen